MFEIAVKTAYEYEECSCSIEMNYNGDGIEPYEWAEEVRIESFIVSCMDRYIAVINKEERQPVYEEYLHFINEECLKKPVNEFTDVIMQVVTDETERKDND